MGNVCANTTATSVGVASTDEQPKPKKKRSIVGNMVHNVKTKLRPKPKWNDSKPEPYKVRKNHSELDDYVEKKQPLPGKHKKEPKPKAYNLSDGVPDDSGYGGFTPEAGIFAHGGDAHGGDAHGGDGGGDFGDVPF